MHRFLQINICNERSLQDLLFDVLYDKIRWLVTEISVQTVLVKHKQKSIGLPWKQAVFYN